MKTDFILAGIFHMESPSTRVNFMQTENIQFVARHLFVKRFKSVLINYQHAIDIIFFARLFCM